MKKHPLPFASAAVLLLLVLASCQKAHEYFLKDTDGTIPCQIEKFIVIDPASSFRDTLIFKYNALGDPVSATRKDPGTGHPNFLFRYDHLNRLTDYLGVYSDTNSAEYWHRYYYYGAGKDRFTMDTTYTLLTKVNGVLTTYLGRGITKFQYDTKNRVNKVTVYFGQDSSVSTIQYDPQGNVSGAGYTFDNKVNFHRTNKVWMFIDVDYDVNNRFTAAAYNSFELPTLFQGPLQGEAVSQGQFLGIFYFDAAVEYGCP